MALASNTVFTARRYGSVCSFRYKGREFILLKPSTFMNLSGNAVSYWLKKEKIPVENLLVIVDDIALPLGSIKMKPKGGDGGHNGLAHINSVLATSNYSRIRVGIGNGFRKGSQVNYVLGKWDPEEKRFIKERIAIIIEMIRSFGTAGTELTMTAFNRAAKLPVNNEKEDDPDKQPK